MQMDYQDRLSHFGSSFSELLLTGRCNGSVQEFGSDLQQLAIDWADRDVQMLASGVDSQDDIRQACSALNLSPIFVEAVLSSYDGASERCGALSEDIEFTLSNRLTGRVKDVAAALLLGGKPILCP